MQYRDERMKKIKSQIKLLTACVCLAQHSYALELIEEQELGHITGQDGITITHEVSKVEVEQLNWYDPNADVNTKMGLGLHKVEILGKDQNAILSQLKFDVGATDAGAGIRLEASVAPFSANADFKLVSKDCVGTSCVENNQNLGKLGLAIDSPFKMVLHTTAGLFNKNETATIDFNLQDATIKHTLGTNSLVLDNFNFNFAGTGYMYIDPIQGVVLASKSGTQDHLINLKPVAVGTTGAQTAGLNFDLRYQNGDGDLKNIMRYGISGAVSNARLSLGADQSKLNSFDISNKVGGVLTRQDRSVSSYNAGEGGLHLGLSADFTNQEVAAAQGLKPTTLEIGHTGKGSYAVQFNELRSLTGKNNAYIDFGDIYINTIQAQSLEFLVNDNIKSTLRQSNPILQQTLSSTSANQDFALIAIRGMDFQSIAAKANFISNDTGIISGNSGSWGIGIPIYNLNANVALSGTKYDGDKNGIAYNVMASTEGYGKDAKTGAPSTTSILLIDGGVENGHARNYYAGLRNIDAFIESKGVIGYEDEGIYVKADKLLIAAKAEVAIGQLPGSKYNCVSGNKCDQFVPDDNFSKRDDVLTTIAMMLDGSGELMIIPGLDVAGENYLSLDANFKFRTLTSTEKGDVNNLGSYFSLINEDVDSIGAVHTSAINFNRMEGNLGLITKIGVSEDTVTLDNQIKFNKDQKIIEPFRTNMAMTTNGNMQNIATIALTGGTMRSTLGITPR